MIQHLDDVKLGKSTSSLRDYTLVENVTVENGYEPVVEELIQWVAGEELNRPFTYYYYRNPATDKQLAYIADLSDMDDMEYIQLVWVSNVYGLDMAHAATLIDHLKQANKV